MAEPIGLLALFRLSLIPETPASSAASFIALENSRAMPFALPTNWPTVRNMPGKSLGPTTISATTPMTRSSVQPRSNMEDSDLVFVLGRHIACAGFVIDIADILGAFDLFVALVNTLFEGRNALADFAHER